MWCYSATLKWKVLCTECSFSECCGEDISEAEIKSYQVMASHERRYKHVVMRIFCDSGGVEVSS